MLLLIREQSPKKSDMVMNVRILLDENDVVMRIRYGGDMFNPLSYYERLDLSSISTVDDALRQKEYLGLKMVVSTVTKMDYSETFGINNLTITLGPPFAEI